ncbi:hypothetical protein VSS37_09015 [Candidatus Thiothrix sp. Deng01]|uniref:Lipocalin-like domain-containing protein n=1 Tax=Candidatus Thiothrix phosphatis TaxID=3112415 RepID=A0ABU6CW94_9GAMM|nr:hypothetical protein [Candidatus Thiothrix sp. Deng01]MEB4591116.1 hypothetical protein [Candidatus Thiothrix sp. Deng01]
MNNVSASLAILTALSLVGCGGGGGGTSTTTPTTPTTPTTKLAAKADLLGLWDSTRIINGQADVSYLLFTEDQIYAYDYMNDPYDVQNKTSLFSGQDCYVQDGPYPVLYNADSTISIYDKINGWINSPPITITGLRADLGGMLGTGSINKSNLSATSFKLCF